MPEFDSRELIILDESGFKLNMVEKYARGLKGERVKFPAPCYSENISVISAIRLSGIVEMSMIEGTMDALSVETFIEKMLLPKLKRVDILVLDNALIHNMNHIKKILEPVGILVLPLPPYSPDLSPIELLWSKLKSSVKKIAPRTI